MQHGASHVTAGAKYIQEHTIHSAAHIGLYVGEHLGDNFGAHFGDNSSANCDHESKQLQRGILATLGGTDHHGTDGHYKEKCG